LLFEEVPFKTVEQGRRGRQDTGSPNQDWAQPQDERKKEPMKRRREAEN